MDAAGFTALLWGIAVAFPAARALFPNVALDPLAIDYTTTTAAIATLLVFIAAALRLTADRRLEMGVADRAAEAAVGAGGGQRQDEVGGVGDLHAGEEARGLRADAGEAGELGEEREEDGGAAHAAADTAPDR